MLVCCAPSARSLTPNACDAEDLLQTALTKTYIAWERIEDHKALDGYVRRALVNTRTSQWRKRKVDEFVCEELPEPDPVPAPDPAEQQVLRQLDLERSAAPGERMGR